MYPLQCRCIVQIGNNFHQAQSEKKAMKPAEKEIKPTENAMNWGNARVHIKHKKKCVLRPSAIARSSRNSCFLLHPLTQADKLHRFIYLAEFIEWNWNRSNSFSPPHLPTAISSTISLHHFGNNFIWKMLTWIFTFWTGKKIINVHYEWCGSTSTYKYLFEVSEVNFQECATCFIQAISRKMYMQIKFKTGRTCKWQAFLFAAAATAAAVVATAVSNVARQQCNHNLGANGFHSLCASG